MSRKISKHKKVFEEKACIDVRIYIPLDFDLIALVLKCLEWWYN
jgi:hypothetical protein